MAGLHNFTVLESGNAQLGQAGSIFIDDTNAVTPSRGVIVAITMVEDTTFSSLLSEAEDSGSKFYANTAGASASATSNSNAIDSSNTFPAGVTIFGRWTSVTLNGGSVIAYLG